MLRDLGGVVRIFPNGVITTLSNLRNGWYAYIFDIGVAYKENTEHVIENMQWEVGREFLRRVKYAFDKNTILDSDQFNGLYSVHKSIFNLCVNQKERKQCKILFGLFFFKLRSK